MATNSRLWERRKAKRERVLQKCACMRAKKDRLRVERCGHDPIRVDGITEIVIRDTRPMRTTIVLRFVWEDQGSKYGRARVYQGDRQLSLRPVAANGIGELVAMAVR